jgi:ubiquinone/menaquinone biosynthesis C-methylase UbiE
MSQLERWQVEGNAPEAYERHLVPTLFTPWAEDLLTRVPLQPGERVLDVACGTGIVARLATAHVGVSGHVVGVDLNRGMLDMARTQMLRAGVPVEWQEGDATALPCDDATFDVVCCQQGFQFFPDKAGALREMRRVLIPGGRLALSVWRSLPYNSYPRLLADVLERHVSSEAATGMRAPCGFGDAEALRTLLTEAGFDEVRLSIVILTLRHPSLATFIPGQLAATPFASAVAALDADAQSALLDDILTIFQPYTDDEGLAVPMEAHVAVARKL